MHLIRGSIIILLAGLLTGCNENSIASCDPDDWCAGPEPVTDGLNTVTSEGRIREFYVQFPTDYKTSTEPKPLLFAYHGTGGTYDLWVDGYYDLADAVGDGAIMVFMQATEDQNGVNQWDYDFDLQYFEDVLTRLSEVVEFDPNRIFVRFHVERTVFSDRWLVVWERSWGWSGLNNISALVRGCHPFGWPDHLMNAA